jgi:hypothetical protein
VVKYGEGRIHGGCVWPAVLLEVSSCSLYSLRRKPNCNPRLDRAILWQTKS